MDQLQSMDFLQYFGTMVLTILGSGGLWMKIQKSAEKKDFKRQMLLGLAHDRLVFLSMRYLSRGWVSTEEFENIDRFLYEPYKALDGNGTVSKLMDDVRKLRILTSIHHTPVHKEVEE